MRRILFMVLVGGALVALVPATALAARHHSKAHHHARHHARRHSRVRFERFGAASSSSSQSTSSTQSGQDNGQAAGKIALFQNGTLTITLPDNSSVSGKVTPDTQIECQAEDTSSTQDSSSTMQRDDHGRNNGDQGNDNGNDQGDDNGNDQGEANDNDDQGQAQNCSTADLQPGTVVREAELKVSGAGATWDKIDLVSSSSQTGAGGDDDGADS